MTLIIQYINTCLPPNVEKDTHTSFIFQDSDGYIELVFNEKQKYPFNGWNIVPHVFPSRVCIFMICMMYNVSIYITDLSE